jgi:hypothetical protein
MITITQDISINKPPTLDFLTETGDDGKPCHSDSKTEALEHDIVFLMKDVSNRCFRFLRD